MESRLFLRPGIRATALKGNIMARSNGPGSSSPAPVAFLPAGKEGTAGRRAVIGGAVVAALGGLLFGFDTAVISGTNEALQKIFGLDSFWLGFTVAIAMIGTIVGSFGVGKPSDRFGRKNTLFALAAGFFLSSLGCGVARSWPEFVLARFIGGLAIGGTSMVTPMYIAEISPPRLRGRLVMVNQLNIVLGVLLSYVSNYVIAQYFEFDVAWRWMLGLLAIPSGIFFFLIFSIPESPRSLVKRGRLTEARTVLAQLGENDTEKELAAIRASLVDQAGHVQERLLVRPYGRLIFLACAMAIFNQLTGINAMLYYAPNIFRIAGALRDSSLLQSIAMGGTLLVFTIIAMFIIDRFGRRILLLIGSVGMALCLFLLAAAFSSGSRVHGGLVLGALIGSIAFFALSQGAVMFVFISEIFPNAVRAKGQALGTFVHWTMAATVTWSFPVVAQQCVAGAFGFFAVMMTLQFFFVWCIMPETKNASLEEIGKRLALGARERD
jgi:SP family xylose:H+ symportor-like MFS transporter